MTIEELLPIAAGVFLLAGIIKGLVGVGLPTAVISMLSQFTDPRIAIAMLLLPALVSNIFQAHKNKMILKSIKLFWPFLGIMIIGILIFSQYAADFSADTLTIFVGIMIMVFVIVNLFVKPIAIPERFDLAFQIVLGAIAGIIGGLTSLWAPAVVVYLMSKHMPKNEFVGAMGILLLGGSLPLLAGYWQAGLTTPTLLLYSALMVIPTLLGVALGEKGRHFLNGQQFRIVLLGVFFILGINLIRTVIL